MDWNIEAPWVGHPSDTEEEIHVFCPKCSKECEEIFISDGVVFGCEHCVVVIDSWDLDQN